MSATAHFGGRAPGTPTLTPLPLPEALDNLTPKQRDRIRTILAKRASGLTVAAQNIARDAHGPDPEAALVSLEALLRRALLLRSELRAVATIAPVSLTDRT